MPDATQLDRFGSVIAALDAMLDWDELAADYCDGDARGFFDDERRAGIRDTGLLFAADLGEALQSVESETAKRSLYIGAAVAELVPILFEAVVLGRDVRWFNLPGREIGELRRGLGEVSKELSLDLPAPETGRWRGRDLAPCDHLWMTSVLTDPVAFPALHDWLYDRTGTSAAVGGGDRLRERVAADRLVGGALDSLAPLALVTTTDEELAILEPAVAARGGALETPPFARLSGIVGDPVRISRWRQER